MLDAIREVQIPLLAALLLGGCATKLTRTLRTGSVDDGLGPTALFPMSMRKPLAMTMCAIELGLGVGLILTAGSRIGAGAPATCVRLGVFLLFVVATSALIELRQTRPDVGCGCFGDFSTTPVSGRTLARSALLAISALATLGMPPIRVPHSAAIAVELLAILTAELLLIGVLSPEVGEGLIRLGYSEPCELRIVPSARTVAALRRSKQWRRYSGVISSDVPADIWRELCWRYVVYPAELDGHRAELVFAVYLQHRRPAIHAALVDAGTGLPMPWPESSPAGPRRAVPADARRLAPAPEAGPAPARGPRRRPDPAPQPAQQSAPQPGPAAARGDGRRRARGRWFRHRIRHRLRIRHRRLCRSLPLSTVNARQAKN